MCFRRGGPEDRMAWAERAREGLRREDRRNVDRDRSAPFPADRGRSLGRRSFRGASKAGLEEPEQLQGSGERNDRRRSQSRRPGALAREPGGLEQDQATK